MAGFLNKVQLIGNLGRDPEVYHTQGGTKIVNLSIATSEQWTDKQNGERRERTEWHRVVVFGDGLGNIVEQYLRKGSKVFVEGALQTRKYTDQAGQERLTTQVVLQPFNSKLIMLDGGNGRGSHNGGDGGSSDQRPSSPNGGRPDLDDEVPF